MKRFLLMIAVILASCTQRRYTYELTYTDDSRDTIFRDYHKDDSFLLGDCIYPLGRCGIRSYKLLYTQKLR